MKEIVDLQNFRNSLDLGEEFSTIYDNENKKVDIQGEAIRILVEVEDKELKIQMLKNGKSIVGGKFSNVREAKEFIEDFTAVL